MSKNESLIVKISVAVLVVGAFTAGALLRKARQADVADPAPTPAVSVDSASDEVSGSPADTIDLKVLYVGLMETPRFNAFNELLANHFTQVETADYTAFREEQTDGFDAVIFDYDGVKWAPMSIKVSPEYGKPTVTVGVPGAFWCDRRNLKSGYM